MASEKTESTVLGKDIEHTAEAGSNGSQDLAPGQVIAYNEHDPTDPTTAGYHRRLTKRQIMFITFGAGIGTGLWVGTGQALKYGK